MGRPDRVVIVLALLACGPDAAPAEVPAPPDSAGEDTGDGPPDLAVVHDYAIGIIPGWENPRDEPQWW